MGKIRESYDFALEKKIRAIMDERGITVYGYIESVRY